MDFNMMICNHHHHYLTLLLFTAYTTWGVAGRKRRLSAACRNAWAGGMLYKDSVSLIQLIQVFRGRPLALQPLNLVLYARWVGWCIGSHVRCPNHLILWCWIWWWMLFVPTIPLFLVLGIMSLLVLLTAFLKHLISQVVILRSRGLVTVQAWHRYVSVGKEMEFVILLFVCIGMSGCFHSGESWQLTLLAFCILFSISLFIQPSSVNILPRYLNSLTYLRFVLLVSMMRVPGVLLTFIVSVLLILIFISYSLHAEFKLEVCSWRHSSDSRSRLWSSAKSNLLRAAG